MRNKRLITLIGSICLILVLAALPFMAACPAPPPAEEEEAPPPPEEEEPTPVSPVEIEIVYASGSTETSFMYLSAKAAADWLEEQSKGRLKVTFYTGGSLIGYREAYSGVVSGAADWSDVIVALYAGQFPLTMGLGLVPGYSTGTLNGRDNMILVQEFLLDEWREVKVLYYMGVQGDTLITRDKKVRTLADLKGMRIRASGTGLKVVERWGAVPVTISTGEMYENLQKGAIDAVLTQNSALLSLHLAEVCKYTHNLFPFQNVGISIMNLDKYNSLPDDLKKLVDELQDWVPEKCGEIADRQCQLGVEALLAAGGEVVEFTEAERAEFFTVLEDINEEWAAEVEAQGLPGRELLARRNELWEAHQTE